MGAIARWQELLNLFKDDWRQVDVMDFIFSFVVKVGMLDEVGAVACGAAFVVNLADELAAYQGFQAIVQRATVNTPARTHL